MKTPFKSIVHVLRLNRFVVLAVVIASVLVCMVAMVLVGRIYRESLNGAFVVNGEGEVIPLSWAEQRDHLEVEAPRAG